MSSASRSCSPLLGNQCRYWSLARKPIASTQTSIDGTDQSPRNVVPVATSKVPPRFCAATTPVTIDTTYTIGNTIRLRSSVTGSDSFTRSITGRLRMMLLPRSGHFGRGRVATMSPGRMRGSTFFPPDAFAESATARAARTAGSSISRTGKPTGETLLSQRRYCSGSGLSRP